MLGEGKGAFVCDPVAVSPSMFFWMVRIRGNFGMLLDIASGNEMPPCP